MRWFGLLVAAALALAAPVAATVRVNDFGDSFRPIREQSITDVLVPSVSAADATAYRTFAADPPIGTGSQAAVLVVKYHDVRPATEPSSNTGAGREDSTVTPEELAAQLQMLSEAGFESISTETLLRSRQDPAVLPARPVMITFDGGTGGVWRYAHPLLERYGFRGVAFAVTGRLDTHYPYYLTWDELSALHRTGRWDVESHSDRGHDRIPVGNGLSAPFLINLMRRDDGSLETAQEAGTRVAADADRAIDQLVTHGLPRPRLFAHPFGAQVAPSNDAAFGELSRRIIAERYPLVMTNSRPARWAGAADLAAGVVPRLRVLGDTSPRALFDLITAALPAGTPPG